MNTLISQATYTDLLLTVERFYDIENLFVISIFIINT